MTPNRARLLKATLTVTGVILTAPAFIFMLGYVKPLISIGFVLVALVTLYPRFKHSYRTDWQLVMASFQSERGLLFATLLTSLFWMLLSGTGGVGFQHNDHKMHNTMLDLLIRESWPVVFTPDYMGTKFNLATAKPLVYYIGHFMPAAVVGKLFGWQVANLAQFCWTWLELWLVFLLASLYVVPNRPVRSAAWVLFATLLMLTSGAGLVAWLVRHLSGVGNELNWDGANLWSFPLLFSSHVRVLHWVPQHGMAAWLLILFVLHQLRRLQGLSLLAVPVAASLLCTPFAAVGALPFLVLLLFQIIRQRQLTTALSWPNVLVGGMLLVCLASFIASNEFSFAAHYLPRIWGKKAFLVSSTLFLTVEIGGGLLILWLTRRFMSSTDWLMVAVSVGSLAFITQFHIGVWNDWCGRASVPAVMILSLFVVRQLIFYLAALPSFGARLACVLAFSIGAATPLATDLRDSFTAYQIKYPTPKEFRDYDNDYVTHQRLGNESSFFFTYLAR